MRFRVFASAGVALLLGLGDGTFIPRTAQAQTGATVTGTVTDAESNQPLVGVQVSIYGTGRGAQTNDAGTYTIRDVPPGVVTVEARRIGFQPGRQENVRVTASGPNVVNFSLSVSVLRLQTVVTSGVVDPVEGVKVPFTVAKLTAADMPVPSTGSAAGMIMGKVAGANVIRGTGPMAGVTIQLRTPTSQFKSTSPMFIVDGVVLSQSFGLTTADIDNLDIASMEVIKGAAASSLYGSRAANGVISITTNRGGGLPEGTRQVRTRSEIGFNNVVNFLKKPAVHAYKVNQGDAYVDANGVTVEPLDYIDANGNWVPRTARINDRLTNEGTGFMDNPYKDRLYDHQRDFWKPGQFMSNNISLQQNSLATTFAVNYTNTQEPGALKWNEGVERHVARVNLDHRVRDNILVSLSVNHTRSTEDPEPISFTDLSRIDSDIDLFAPGPAGQAFPYRIRPDSNSTITNPLYRLWRNDALNRRTRTLMSTDVTYTPLNWLTFNGNFGYDRSDRDYDSFVEKGTIEFNGEDVSPGSIYRETNFTDGISGQLGATVLQAFGDLTVRTTARGLIEKEVNQLLASSANTFTTSGVRRHNAALNQSSSSSDTDRRALSALVSTGVDYAGKYIADFLVRRDGNSLFGPSERWNTYYRVAGAYRMGEEEWWPFSSNINEFKLRYAQGSGGTRPDFLDQYETLQLETGGGVIRRVLGNPFLRPEVSTERELALETIIRNRVSVQLVQVWNHSKDNIISVAVPAITGYNTQELNTGEIKARTFEVTVQAQMLNRQNLRWEVNLVGDHSRNRVTEFNRPCYGDGLLLRCEGEILGVMRGRRFVEGPQDLLPDARLRADEFQKNDEGYYVWVGPGNTYRDGIAKNLWGTSTSIGGVTYIWGRPFTLRDSVSRAIADTEKIGDSNPTANFGFGNTVTYRQFTFYALLNGQIGGNIYNDARQQLHRSLDSREVDQRGKPDELKKPTSYYSDGLYNNNAYTKNYVESGTYAKLSEASVTYRLPQAAVGYLSAVGVSGGRLELVGRNLYTFTNYSGFDPEVGTQLRRVDSIDYPRYRTITGVVSFTF